MRESFFDKELRLVSVKRKLKAEKKSYTHEVRILKVNVFKYPNVQEYIQALYKRNKDKYRNSFSYDYLAQKLGYKNKSFLYKIMRGTKPASDYLINRLINLMDLSIKEAMYLILILHLSKTKIEKEEGKRLIREYKRFLKRKR